MGDVAEASHVTSNAFTLPPSANSNLNIAGTMLHRRDRRHRTISVCYIRLSRDESELRVLPIA